MRSMTAAMQLLTKHSIDRMSLDELDEITGAASFAESEALRLAAVCEGVACLVAEDGNRPGAKMGTFQDAQGVFELLCYVANGIDTIAALIHLGEEAGNRAREMREGGQ